MWNLFSSSAAWSVRAALMPPMARVKAEARTMRPDRRGGDALASEYDAPDSQLFDPQ